MNKKLKKIIRALDAEFTDYGHRTVKGIPIEHLSYTDDNGVKRFEYKFAPEYDLVINSDIVNQDIFVRGKLNSIKHVYKTLCK